MSKTKTVEDFDRQIEKLKAQKQALLKREKAAERKARNHALMVMGAMVEQACGGDWRGIDFYSLDSYFSKWAKSIERTAGNCEIDTLEGAKKHVREYEKWKRESAKKAKQQEAEADSEEEDSEDEIPDYAKFFHAASKEMTND